jgi:hypothetical protein
MVGQNWTRWTGGAGQNGAEQGRTGRDGTGRDEQGLVPTRRVGRVSGTGLGCMAKEWTGRADCPGQKQRGRGRLGPGHGGLGSESGFEVLGES